MKIANINNSLSKAETDRKTGIKMIQLTGDAYMSVFAIELGKGQNIPAHFHMSHIETYFILDGKGLVRTGVITNETLHWNEEISVNAGDCFTIFPGEVHEFTNSSDKILRILGTAPLSHSQHDRYFI